MSAAAWCRVLCCAALLLLLEVKLSSAQSKDVAFPALPAGAGEIAKDAPKQFTQTASGLRYRILRAGKGADAHGNRHGEGELPRLARRRQGLR